MTVGYFMLEEFSPPETNKRDLLRRQQHTFSASAFPNVHIRQIWDMSGMLKVYRGYTVAWERHME